MGYKQTIELTDIIPVGGTLTMKKGGLTYTATLTKNNTLLYEGTEMAITKLSNLLGVKNQNYKHAWKYEGYSIYQLRRDVEVDVLEHAYV